MSKRRQYTDEALQKALEFMHNNEGSARQAAKKFNVPRSTLQFKTQHPEKKSKPGPDPVLTEDEEKDLCHFIINIAKRGFPIKKDDLLLCVQGFLKKDPRINPFRDDKPGDTWFKAFLKRNPNITSRTSEGVTNASQNPNQNPKSGKVLAEKGSKNVYQIEKTPVKENITVLFTFSASGQVCHPMIIYPYKRIPDKVAASMPSGWGIGRSDSGWMTAAVFHDFVENCFHKELMNKNIQLPGILFVDGHKTHITIEVAELCRRLQIHLVALYPNATRILQPIKAGWKKALQEDAGD